MRLVWQAGLPNHKLYHKWQKVKLAGEQFVQELGGIFFGHVAADAAAVANVAIKPAACPDVPFLAFGVKGIKAKTL